VLASLGGWSGWCLLACRRQSSPPSGAHPHWWGLGKAEGNFGPPGGLLPALALAGVGPKRTKRPPIRADSWGPTGGAKKDRASGPRYVGCDSRPPPSQKEDEIVSREKASGIGGATFKGITNGTSSKRTPMLNGEAS
jgi:hypothetical protein